MTQNFPQMFVRPNLSSEKPDFDLNREGLELASLLSIGNAISTGLRRTCCSLLSLHVSIGTAKETSENKHLDLDWPNSDNPFLVLV